MSCPSKEVGDGPHDTPCHASHDEIVNSIRNMTMKTLVNHPDYAQARHAAFILATQGLVSEAIHEYYRAIDIYEKQVPQATDEQARIYADFIPFCLNEMGILLARHNDLQQSLKAFDRAIALLHNSLEVGEKSGIDK